VTPFWRSLRFQLLLGFVFISLVSLVCFALLARNSALRAFRGYLDKSRVENFAAFALDHYRKTGTWQGVERALPPPPPPLVRDNKPGEVSNAPLPPRDLSEVRGRPLLMGLLDADNRVVVPLEGLTVGQLIKVEDYPVRKALELDGQHIGTVIRFTDRLLVGPEGEAFLLTINQTLLLVGIISLFVALALGIPLVQGLTHSLEQLTSASRALERGALGHTVAETGNNEVRQLAKSFNQMSLALEQSANQRRQMVADIAHDLRTPLTVISGYVQSLRNGKLPATQERFDVILDELGLLNNLVEDLRLLSLADADELSLVLQEVRPEALLKRVHDAFKLRADRQAVHLQLETNEPLPVLRVDPERLHQVLSNIVSNALSHTPRGGFVELSASQDAKAVKLKIHDNGEGIAEDKLPYIFERFYRADKSRNGNTGGSGLGLAIAKALVELHGGTISAESKLGEGTTLYIHLPVV
jgi:signal transduction histidine kinase